MSGFRHDALLYEDYAELVAGTVPAIEQALAAGHPVMVAMVQEGAREIAAALGPAAQRVTFADMAELGRNPGRILPAWSNFVSSAAGRPALGIGEPVWPGRDEMQVDECMRHEFLLGVAFRDAPAFTLICPYDAQRLEPSILEAACGVHGPSRPQIDPFAGALPAAPRDAPEISFRQGELALVREFVGAQARLAGIPERRARDLVLAVSELAANSVRHGGGSGGARAWLDDSSLVCEVWDAGVIAEPLAGRLPPRLEEDSGRGLWIVHQLCDLVRVRSGPGGTRVRIHMQGVGMTAAELAS